MDRGFQSKREKLVCKEEEKKLDSIEGAVEVREKMSGCDNSKDEEKIEVKVHDTQSR